MVSDGISETAAPGDADLLRLIIESATDFAVFAQDESGRVISWNIGAERLTGYSEQEILGVNGDIIFTPEDRAGRAPERERSEASLKGRSEDERWHVRKDGSRFWGSGLMMRLNTGVGFVKIMRDRTAQHAKEHELAQSEARFRMLAVSIPQLVFRCRNDGARTWGSPQWEIYAGLSDANSRGFAWLEAIHPDDRQLTRDRWQDAQRAGEYYVEHRIRRVADGQYRWHQTRAKPAGVSAADWVGTSADVHEMRGLQDRQQVLLSELQHRTRNLLALVQAIARQTMKSSVSLQDFSREFESRLGALSRVQGVLARTDQGPIDLEQIVRAELEAMAPVMPLRSPGRAWSWLPTLPRRWHWRCMNSRPTPSNTARCAAARKSRLNWELRNHRGTIVSFCNGGRVTSSWPSRHQHRGGLDMGASLSSARFPIS